MSKESKTMEREAQVKARAKEPWTARRVGDLILNNALIIIMVIAVIYIAIVNKNFMKPASIINILAQTCAYLPVALGVGGCIVLTGTDLSAGRIVGLTACISASLLQAVDAASKMWPNLTPPPVILVLILARIIGGAIGAFNGFFVAKFKLHPFIVTLATQLIIYTLLLLYVKAGENNGMAISGLDKSYSNFITGSLPFAAEDIAVVKRDITLSSGKGLRFMGKTGSGSDDADRGIIGWFVGGVETPHNRWSFAVNIQGPDASGVRARGIAEAALKRLSILP